MHDDAENTEREEQTEPEEQEEGTVEGSLVEPHEEPDVLLDVPVLKVDEIHLEVEDLRARVTLQAEVLDLVKLNVGADVALGRVKLDITGVEAQALLKVRLDNITEIVGRVLTTVDRNPQILEQLTSSVGSAVRDVGSGVGGGAEQAVGELGRGTGEAMEKVGTGAEQAVEDVGAGAGKATEDVGSGAGKAAGDIGSGVERTVKDVGGQAGEAVEDAVGSADEVAGAVSGTAGSKGGGRSTRTRRRATPPKD